MEASTLIEALRALNPQAVELAKVVSLATRVEPYLLRRARLELLPQAGADAEADLWFSPLVESRSPLGLVLTREAADALRARLLTEPRLLEASWRLIREAHRHAHPTIRLEERLVRLLLAGADDESEKPPEEEVEELLHQALAGLASEEDAVGVARWALRALPRLPRRAFESAAAEALALGAGARLDGRRVLDAGPRGEEQFPGTAALEKLRWVLPAEATVEVGVRLLDNGVEFSQPPAAGAHTLEVPKTNPLLFELLDAPTAENLFDGDPFEETRTYSSGGMGVFRERVRQSRRGEASGGAGGDADGRVVAHVSLPLGRKHVEPVDVSDLRIRTARGALYALRPVLVEQPKPDYWFYLSHSRFARAGDKRYLQKFYADLSEEIERHLGVDSRASQIGFFDLENIWPGDDWQPATVEALNNCRAVVCLLAPNYFSSEGNGRELQFFLARLDKFASSHHMPRPPLMFPVKWEEGISPHTAPAVFSEMLWFSGERGEGVADLLRLKREKEYQRLLFDLARSLVLHAGQYTIPPLEPPPSLAEVRNAFEAPAGTPAPDAGPRSALFLYVAGSAEEMGHLKKDTRYYGNVPGGVGGDEWRPFLSETGAPVFHLAQRVTADFSLYYERFDINVRSNEESILRSLSEAELMKKIVVILLDPWALFLEWYRHLLESVRGLGMRNCAVLILWNEQDEDLSRNDARKSLSDAVRKAFAKWKFGGTSDLVDVRSAAEFESALAQTLKRLRDRLMHDAPPGPTSNEPPPVP